MKQAKRAQLMVAKANRRPLHLGPGPEFGDHSQGDIQKAIHRVCGGPGDINRRLWQATCASGCVGHRIAVPCEEMAG